jgi:hypothetical protein
MERNLDKILSAFVIVQYPDPFWARIYARFASAKDGGVDHRVVIALQGNKRVIPRVWLASQSGISGDYYTIPVPYPHSLEKWKGTVSAVTWDETKTTQPSAQICFSQISTELDIRESYIQLNCDNGATCTLVDKI